MVPKKTAGDWRPCSDYQALNNATTPDRYRIQDYTASLHIATILSTVYHQIPVDPAEWSNYGPAARESDHWRRKCKSFTSFLDPSASFKNSWG